MSEVFVVGAAATAARLSTARLAHEAAAGALADAGVLPERISAVFVGSGVPGPEPGADAVAVRLGLRRLGLGTRAGAGTEAGTEAGASAGASGPIEHVSVSGAQALHLAFRAVESGIEELVLCVGTADGEGGESPWESWPSQTVLFARAQAARRFTARQLARVVMKNRGHGAIRGIARALELEDVLDGEVLAWPLTRPMVAAGGSGAAAVVLSSRPAARRIARARVRIRASTLLRDGTGGADGTAGRAARLAYRDAGLGAEDLDLAELHDCTAGAELAAYEQLGIAPEGYAGELVESGFTSVGGVLPVNVSGGLLSLGERPGACAIAQVSELTRQLRGVARHGQVPHARAALAHSAGRPSGSGATVVGITVLSC